MKKRPSQQSLISSFYRLLQLTVGAVITSFAYAIFQVPFHIAAGGIGGLSLVVNHFSGLSVGVLYLLMNIPLLALGFYYLGRWPFLLRTLYAVAVFSFLTDYFLATIPHVVSQFPLTHDVLLSTVYGGIVGGIGGGLIYRSGSTAGGTGILGRVIQQKTGMPLSQVYLWTDGMIVITMGMVFGWEIALYAMLALFLNGMASDYVLDGPSSVRTVTIITDREKELTSAIMRELHRGVSSWQIEGGYTRQPHWVVLCTINRPQLNDLKRLVAEIDEDAFVTVGVVHQALGKGFSPLKS